MLIIPNCSYLYHLNNLFKTSNLILLQKKRGTVMDFFASPFDTKPFGFGAHMGGMGGHGLHGPMSGYYGAAAASMTGMAGLGSNFCSMYSGQPSGKSLVQGFGSGFWQQFGSREKGSVSLT